MLEAPGSAGEWLKERLASLAVMYRAAQAISNVLDVDALLPQVLQLVFDSIGADRGAILLRDESGELAPKAVRWRGEAEPDERLTISRTIVEHVFDPGPGRHHLRRPGRPAVRPGAVDRRLRHPRGDLRPGPGAARHARRPLCRRPARALDVDGRPAAREARFARDHLKLMVALGHQAGLAIENTSSTRPRSRPSGSRPSARRSRRSRTTSRTSSRASAAAATSSTWA